jgi:hypothetical protein
MKKIIYLLIVTFLTLNIGCCEKPPLKPCENCPKNSHCENDSCELDAGFYYSNSNGTGEIIEIFPSNLDENPYFIPACTYYNYSFKDTPWITPRRLKMYIDENNKFVADGKIMTIFNGNLGYNFMNCMSFSNLTTTTRFTKKGNLIDSIYLVEYESVYQKPMKNDSITNTRTRVLWNGKVSEDYKTINFDVYFLRPKFITYGPWDTVKIIRNYLMTKDPSNKPNCKFCE